MELGWCPHRVALVADCAVCSCGNMVHALASSFRAIVATSTSGGTGEGAVIGLGAGPDRG